MKKLKFDKEKIVQLIKEHWILLLILLFGFCIRVYRLNEMANYDFDQEYVTNFVLDVVRIYPIRYVGQGLSVEGLFMGAWYFYAMLPGYLMTGLDPIGGFVFSILLGSIITFAYYFVGKELFFKQAGLIAAFIRATSFYAMQSDWSMIPSHSSDLSVLITWYCFYKIYQGKEVYFYLLALTFGLFTSFHPIQFPFYFIFLILLLVWKKRVKLFTLLVSPTLFILPSVPLILFDYWRKWAMFRQILGMFTNRGSSHPSASFLSQLVERTRDVVDFFGGIILLPGGVMYTPWGKTLIGVLLIGVAVYMTYLLTKSKETKFHITALITTFVFFLVYYAVFPTHVSEYYLGALKVLIMVYFSFVLGKLAVQKYKKVFVFLFLMFILMMNGLQYYSKLTNPSNITLGHKKQIVQKVIEVAGDDEYALSYVIKPGWGSGYDSLLRLYNHEDAGKGKVITIVSPLEVLQDKSELDFVSGNAGVIFPKEK